MDSTSSKKVSLKEAAFAMKAFTDIAFTEGKKRAREDGHSRARSVLPLALKFVGKGFVDIESCDPDKIENTLKSVGIDPNTLKK